MTDARILHMRVEFTREYVDIARARLAYWMAQGVQLSLSDELTA